MSARSSTRTSLLALAAFVGLGIGCSKDNDAPPPLASAAPSSSAAKPPLKVAAAADLAFAFKDVAEAYEKKTGQKVVFSFGSTGLLAKQISEGAPFDVFAAANISFIDDVVKAKSCLDDSKTLYARGRIVVWTKKGSPKPASLADLKDKKYAKVAIANPEHAPYGRAAKEALTKVGAWDSVSPRLVFGENVQQTLQFAQSGNAEASIVALSLAVGPAANDGEYTMIDPELHAPLDQALVVCHGAPEAKDARIPDARAFTQFVSSEDGRTIMKRYGFLLPGETLSSTTAKP
ncbi:MAG: Molybdenum transporter, periplasmic molybdenum-binding protein ModA [Myxococcaceae bacterium]|nr:Molybdenum transporter, periplasmic molybdenum-binding protein ModA [Myxococcaceae bacterium]